MKKKAEEDLKVIHRAFQPRSESIHWFSWPSPALSVARRGLHLMMSSPLTSRTAKEVLLLGSVKPGPSDSCRTYSCYLETRGKLIDLSRTS